MSKMTVYAVVDYVVDRKEEILTALCYCAKRNNNLRFCDSYDKAKAVASAWLGGESEEVAIIPMEIDTDDISCLFTEIVVRTIKLDK